MIKKRLNLLWIKIRAYKYTEALEKIAFTTLGLLLALWINNWNDALKQQKIERQTLLEIKSGLQQDERDIDETLSGFGYRYGGAKYLLQHLGDSSSPSPQMLNYFNAINGYSFLLANTGAYETLKSRGIETISNDSLRIAIATLYDVDYERIQNFDAFSIKFYTEHILPYLHKHFRQTEHGLTPLDFPFIQQDNVYREMVQYSCYSSDNALRDYQALKLKVGRIVAQIEAELKK